MKVSKAVHAAAIALLAAATFLGTGQAAVAAPSHRLSDELALLWTTVLETPSAENALGAGGEAYACWDLGHHVVAPFSGSGVASCTVKPGTRIFVVGSSHECSTFDLGLDPECRPDLSGSAKEATREVTSVTVDGRQVPLTAHSTSGNPITLPAGNLFEAAPGSTGEYAAYGWVTLLHPLPPGTHTIVGPTFTTTIIVRPGRN
jgi:hypothetical protein